MRARLGINNCFAVKRWPRPDDWASIVANDLGLDLVELSLDLLAGPDTPAGRERMAEQIRAALAGTACAPRPRSPAWPRTRSTCSCIPRPSTVPPRGAGTSRPST